jgi:hypothetical protein
MTITYEVPIVPEGSESVQVTFTNKEGNIFVRGINVPRNIDGTVNTVAFTNVLEAQLRGIEYKVNLGVVTFTSPTTEP